MAQNAGSAWSSIGAGGPGSGVRSGSAAPEATGRVRPVLAATRGSDFCEKLPRGVDYAWRSEATGCNS